MRQELFVISASGNFAQYIQLPQIGIQGEVQTVTNRFFVEDKGQARRRTTQVWMERPQSLNQSADIVATTRIHHIYIIGRVSQPEKNRCPASNDDKTQPA